MKTYVKDPGAVLDYSFDWGEHWLAVGETISTSTWTVETGITADSNSHDATTTTVFLSGGTAGENYQVTNHITTSQARQDERSLTIQVRQR